MTLREQLCILNALVGCNFKYQNLFFTDSDGHECQLIAIGAESNGEIYITLKKSSSRKEYDTSLKCYNTKTGRSSYDHVLIKGILHALGRKRIREIKENM